MNSETDYGNYDSDHWLTEPEACEWLKINRATLYRLRRDGLVKCFLRLGNGKRGTLRYSWKELRDVLQVDDKELSKLHKIEARRGKTANK